MLRCHLIISGQVQGVGYRWFAWNEAKSLKLTGFVRNLNNGAVEVEVQGTESAVNTYIDKLRVGPRLADVRGFERTTLELRTEEEAFHIDKS